MRSRIPARPWASALGGVAALTLMLLILPGQSAGAADPSVRALSVNLASPTGKSHGVGLGILYGINEDGSQPADEYLKPLQLNAFRGGGWFSGGWIKDDYQYGDATKADIASIVAQARRLQGASGKHFQYQVLLSDLYGANAG